jgi:hypothetical protein
MGANTAHFRVGNGDMTLFEMEGGRTVLADINIRGAADDPDEKDIADVAKQLRKRLKRDAQGRLYVDAFLLTHPDQDHCRGLRNHFHLGPLSEWSKDDDKIVIREMWSSPMVFRRASKKHSLCEDAKAWNAEARRRVQKFRTWGFLADGDRILILGEDVDGKTDDLGAILVKVDQEFGRICGADEGFFKACLIAPLPPSDDEDEEETLSKNNSSVVMALELKADHVPGAARYLLGGDAEVAIWERIWDRNSHRPSVLEYDVMIAPHHCSWHSLSWYSWSVYGESAPVSLKARNALGQARSGATILSSSKTICDDDRDPPCTRARREYKDILKSMSGTFTCIADPKGLEPYEIEVTYAGARPKWPAVAAASVATGTGLGAQPWPHG